MAPTLRPRKAKSGSEPTARTSAKGKSGLVDQPAQFSGPVNLTGFAALPPELILEVVDYFLSVPIPSPHLNRPLDRSHLDRHHILRYLSQLCQSLRHLLLPYVWRSLEVCTVKTETLGTLRVSVPSLSGGRYSPWEKEIATELVNQLEIVTIRNPDYADHVHTVSVIITKFSLKTVLPEFARCLGLLTNLKTLQLHGETWRVKRMVAQEFKKYRYPSIRTVVTTPGNLGVLSACPNLRHLHSTLSPGMMWIPVPCSQSIEKLTGKYGFGYDRLKSLTPNLKYLQILTTDGHTRCQPHWIEPIAQLVKLDVVEIAIAEQDGSPESRIEAQELATAAQAILARLPQVEGVRRIVRIRDLATDTIVI